MKLLMIAVVAFVLFGCHKQAPPSATPTDAPPTEAPTATPAQQAAEPIGMFVTDILDTDEERVNNLQLCASVLTGQRVEGGAVFSFNDTVGQRTQEKGYEKARILIGDTGGYAVGGGVCQISSTLYNAAVDAGMEIIERHDHTKEVHYVPIGQDAAVSYGTLDFRFRNTLSEPISIEIVVENAQVKAIIYKNVTGI